MYTALILIITIRIFNSLVLLYLENVVNFLFATSDAASMNTCHTIHGPILLDSFNISVFAIAVADGYWLRPGCMTATARRQLKIVNEIWIQHESLLT